MNSLRCTSGSFSRQKLTRRFWTRWSTRCSASAVASPITPPRTGTWSFSIRTIRRRCLQEFPPRREAQCQHRSHSEFSPLFAYRSVGEHLPQTFTRYLVRPITSHRAILTGRVSSTCIGFVAASRGHMRSVAASGQIADASACGLSEPTTSMTTTDITLPPKRLKFFVALPGVGMAVDGVPRQKTGLNSIPRRDVGLPWDFNWGFVSSIDSCARDRRARQR
jgi:hypothetical protein